MGERASDSSEQRSRQVITGQANRGPMKHENLPSLKRRSNTHTLGGTYSDRDRDVIRDRQDKDTKTRTSTPYTGTCFAVCCETAKI